MTNPYFSAPNIAVHCGDVREQLRAMAAGSVQTCVTSPPYWALRDYGVEGQLGLEATPELYVANMVEVFREVRRVLRDDGTLWLNIGDTYANDAKGPRGAESSTLTGQGSYQANANPPGLQKGWRNSSSGIKRTDLVGIPWMLAFALRADGWYLRSEVIWHKRSPMPESVQNRPTKAHELVFLLSKSAKYFYDVIGSQEIATTGSKGSRFTRGKTAKGDMSQRPRDEAATRNMRSVWSLSSFPFKGAHFAAFPPELVRRCLSAGLSERGACPTCGAAWVRIVEKVRRPTRSGKRSKVNAMVLDPCSPYQDHNGDVVGNRDPQRHVTEKISTGWRASCSCGAGDPVPCTVLDPFHGAGTTMCVARRLGHAYVGVELKPDYIDLSIERLAVPIVFPHERERAKPRRRRTQSTQRSFEAFEATERTESQI